MFLEYDLIGFFMKLNSPFPENLYIFFLFFSHQSAFLVELRKLEFKKIYFIGNSQLKLSVFSKFVTSISKDGSNYIPRNFEKL